MAIDFEIPLEGDIDFHSFLERLAQQIQFKLEQNDGRMLRLKEASEMLWVYTRRGLTMEDGEHCKFDDPNVDFLPKALFSVRLNKFRGITPKILFARVIRAILDSTPDAAVVLMNGELLMLKRKSGERAATIHYRFWDEESTRLLVAEPSPS